MCVRILGGYTAACSLRLHAGRRRCAGPDAAYIPSADDAFQSIVGCTAAGTVCACVLAWGMQSAQHCAIAKDVSSYGYFQRSTASEFLGFLSKTVAERATAGARTSIEEVLG